MLSTVVGCSAIVHTQQPNVTPLVFDGVTVIDVEHGRHLPEQRVVVVGNRIHTIGKVSAVSLPADAQVVDARGKYLIPGLWDMHIHGERAVGLVYPLLLANGVTGFRNAGTAVPLDTLRLWQHAILAGTRVGPPRQILSGPVLDAEPYCVHSSAPDTMAIVHVCVRDPTKVVDSLKAAGVDMLKIRQPTKEMYFAIAAAARRAGLSFGGHLQLRDLGIPAVEASDSGARILDHLQTAGDLGDLCLGPTASLARCQAMADRFRRNETWVVPTLIVLPAVLPQFLTLGDVGRGLGYPKLFGPAAQGITRHLWQFADTFWTGATAYRLWLRDSTRVAITSGGDSAGLSLMRHVGVPLLAGTDMFSDVTLMHKILPGFALHTELALLVAEGVTPLEALQAATLNPAKLLHGTDSLGTVAPGKLADLLLLDADPLADITNTTAIRAVVANGRYFDRAALDRLLADVQAKGKQQLH